MAIVAFTACVLAVVLFRFALATGASPRAAFYVVLLNFFGPSLLYHTSDTYKDGINAVLVVASVWLAINLARRFSLRVLLMAAACLFALYFVRPYMVVMSLLPLAVGLLGVQSKFSLRSMVALFVFASVVMLGGAYALRESDVGQEAITTFEQATSRNALDYNAEGGSGVTFDDGGNAFGALPQKIAYTLFAPFPWMGGSLGLQLGKIETLLFYFFIVSSARAVPHLLRRDRGTLLMFASFLAPATIVYATTMSNVGLMVRQRMPIVMITSVLASVYWTTRERQRKASPSAPRRADESRRGPALAMPRRIGARGSSTSSTTLRSFCRTACR
jgi:hypothetical protein